LSRDTGGIMSQCAVAKPKALPFRIVAGITALGIVIWISIPRLAVVILPLAVVLHAVLQMRYGDGLRLRRPSPLHVVFLLFAAYLWANALWAEGLTYAVGSAAVITFFLLCWSLGVDALAGSKHRLLRAFAIGLCVGMALGGAYLLIDALGARVIWSAVRVAAIRIANPQLPADIGPYGTTQHYVYPFVLNLGATVFAAMLFPALLVGSAFVPPAWRRLYLPVGISLGFLVVFSTIHASSKIAVSLGSAVFLLFGLVPRAITALITAAWLAATLFVVPITQLAYTLGLQDSRLLGDSARARIVIWKHTSDKVGEAAIRGIGIGSTRVRRKTAPADAMERVPRTEFFVDTSIHAHNFFLQAWYELGAIGAAFLLAVGLFTLEAIRRYPDAVQQHLYASFVAAFTLGNSTFSLFAPWLLATLLLTALFAALGTRIFGASPSTGGPGGWSIHPKRGGIVLR